MSSRKSRITKLCFGWIYVSQSSAFSTFSTNSSSRRLSYVVKRKSSSSSPVTTKLYTTSSSSSSSTTTTTTTINNSNNKLGLLTFDLDDTLFHTGEVVQAANIAMLQAIHEKCGNTQADIPDFVTTTKQIRKTLDTPITYKDLRTRAIQATLEKYSVSSLSSDDATDTVSDAASECYQAWLTERHAAAERYLLDGAMEMLNEIKSIHPTTMIVAITNGAGDPLKMPNTLANYFDFRISGEEPEIFPYRKPDSFIYEYTLRQYQQRRNHLIEKNGNKQNGNNDNDHSHIIHDGIWCHVGDCLVNDALASSKCGAKAIWLNTSIKSNDDDGVDSKRPFYSTATPEEQLEREKRAKNARASVSVEINSLSELPKAIDTLLRQPIEIRDTAVRT